MTLPPLLLTLAASDMGEMRRFLVSLLSGNRPRPLISSPLPLLLLQLLATPLSVLAGLLMDVSLEGGERLRVSLLHDNDNADEIISSPVT